MRTVIFNPGTIRGCVLRQPMFQALIDAGHELLLVVRVIRPLAQLATSRAVLTRSVIGKRNGG